jgi:dolichol-phosphate mannosyltransferase
MSSSTPQVSVVIPALNERENLELLLPALHETFTRLGVCVEVIVVDGGSRDGTADAARMLRASVVMQQERGYGGALMAGFAAARAPFVITMDADLSHRPLFVQEFWARRHDAHLIIASRYIPGGTAEMGRFRRLLSRILNIVYSRVLMLPLHDLSSGFRMYRRETLAALQLQSRDFDVLEEILIKVYNHGWKILEVPFRYMPRGVGRSHARLLKFGWAYLKTLARMLRLRHTREAGDYERLASRSVIPILRYWHKARRRTLLSLLEDRQSVLNAGCGSSHVILDLPDAVGLDSAPSKLRWLSQHRERLVQASGAALPFRDGSFSSVICSEEISSGVLKEMRRVLRPGGVLIVNAPDHSRWAWRMFERASLKVVPDRSPARELTREQVDGLLRREGFAIVDCRYVVCSEMVLKARKPPVSRAAAC